MSSQSKATLLHKVSGIGRPRLSFAGAGAFFRALLRQRDAEDAGGLFLAELAQFLA